MNERIQALWEQADIKFSAHWQHQGIDTAVIIPTDLEKFAELIVRECAEFVRKQNYESIRNEEPYNVTSTDILTHFGVEE